MSLFFGITPGGFAAPASNPEHDGDVMRDTTPTVIHNPDTVAGEESVAGGESARLENASELEAPLTVAEGDDNPNLNGFSTRAVGSVWIDSDTDEPIPPSLRSLATFNHNAIVDRQVATAGLHTHFEDKGEWGQGSMAYGIGIAPTSYGQGVTLGGIGFTTDDGGRSGGNPQVQAGSGTGLRPDVSDAAGWGSINQKASTANASRAARAQSINNFWAGLHGGTDNIDTGDSDEGAAY